MTRVNKFVALATGLSRRSADRAIQAGRVRISNRVAGLGDSVEPTDAVSLDGQPVTTPVKQLAIIFNKPPGYVCSRNGQGSPTVYDLLPAEYHGLKIAGRLDKDSSGLVFLTNDGSLANQLTHPRYAKTKVYEIRLNKPLDPAHQQVIGGAGIQLEDGVSRFTLSPLEGGEGTHWQIRMREGRNRQIRRTFGALGYTVEALHRNQFGDYSLAGLKSGQYQPVTRY